MLVERVAARFGLGRPLRDAVPVPGGLSNELRRLDTDQGAFAVKRMILNAGIGAAGSFSSLDASRDPRSVPWSSTVTAISIARTLCAVTMVC